MKGYKGMNKDMTCRGMHFEVGKTYKITGELELCQNGLHFCKNLRDVFSYYMPDKSRFFEVEAKGLVIISNEKSVTSELSIIRELSDKEVNRCKYGSGDGSGDGYGDGSGDGDGDGYGYGYGSGDGDGYGDGYGYGYGDGYGYGKNIQKILLYMED